VCINCINCNVYICVCCFVTSFEQAINNIHKVLYKTAAVKCKNAIDKFHAARELALVRKNNLGSFFSFINNKLKSNMASDGLKMDDETITTDPSMKAKIFNKFLGVY